MLERIMEELKRRTFVVHLPDYCQLLKAGAGARRRNARKLD
jgi:hypothetical protein